MTQTPDREKALQAGSGPDRESYNGSVMRLRRRRVNVQSFRRIHHTRRLGIGGLPRGRVINIRPGVVG